MAVVDVVLVLVVTRGSLIISDVVVVVLTWTKLYFQTSGNKRLILFLRRQTLSDVFLMDGESLSLLCGYGEACAYP